MLLKASFLASLLLPFSLCRATAQSAPTKEALKTRMAASACECLTKKSATQPPANLSKAQAKQVFAECFGATVGKELKTIQLVYGREAFANRELMRTIGAEVGALLLQSCPQSMTYFTAMAADDKPTSPAEAPATTGQTVGQLGGLSGPGVALLEVQVSATEKAYFAWVRHFEQADELLARLPDLRGRQARVSWQEVEVLQPDTRQYQKVREITAIELL